MARIKAGIIGTGYIGTAHVEALRRLGHVDVVALAEINQDSASAKAGRLNVPRAYSDYRKLIADENIEVIHNCTPTHLHFQINKDIMRAGKHVISEKPLAMNTRQSAELVRLAQKANVVNAINFNYRYYPLVQQAAMMVKKKELGRIFAVEGCYMQDWLLYDTDWNWRLEPKYSGKSRAIGDIGSHWFDLIQFILGKRIIRVCADLVTVHKTRKKPLVQVETFSGKTLKPSQYTNKRILTEDHGHILLELEDGIRGMVCITQLAAGRKNHIVFEILGAQKAVWWDQERPNEMVIGHRNSPNELLLKEPLLLDESVRDYAQFPAGHNEGYPSAVRNFVRNVYRYIANRRGKPDFSTFADGHRANAIVDAVLASHKSKKWVTVKY